MTIRNYIFETQSPEINLNQKFGTRIIQNTYMYTNICICMKYNEFEKLNMIEYDKIKQHELCRRRKIVIYVRLIRVKKLKLILVFVTG